MRSPAGNTPLLQGSLKNLFYPPEKNEYTYFARAGDFPFKSDDPLVKGAPMRPCSRTRVTVRRRCLRRISKGIWPAAVSVS